MSDLFEANEVVTAAEYRKRIAGAKRRGTTRGKDYESMFALHIATSDIVPEDEVEQQVRFHPTRKWRFDFCIPSRMIAIEIDGGEAMRTVQCATCLTSPARMTLKNGRSMVIRLGGGHHTPQGFRKNREKWAEAAILGWTVIGATGKQVEEGAAIDWLERLYLAKGNIDEQNKSS